MNRKIHIYICIVLTLAMISGCVRFLPQKGGPDAPSGQNPSVNEPVTTAADYEQYTKDSLSEQNDFDEYTYNMFIEDVQANTINLHYTLKNPAAYGITDYPITFGDFSLDGMEQDIEDIKSAKAELDTFDETLLTDDQKLTYSILKSWFNTELDFEGLELYYEPLAPSIGVQAQLPVLLCEYSFNSKQDIEDYLELLAQIDEYYTQILEFEKLKADAGLFMSDTSVDHIVESCDSFLLPDDSNFMSTTFEERIHDAGILTEEEKAEYISRNNDILHNDFMNAYDLLSKGLTALKGSGKNEGGICGLPKGKQYYEYLVSSNTYTSYSSISKLKSAIEHRMNSDSGNMGLIMNDDPSVSDRYADYSFAYTEPEDILNHLRDGISKDYPELDDCDYTVKYVPESLENSLSPAFYLTPTIDDYSKNVIYINNGDQFKNMDLYTTLAHEGYPGHLFQNVYFCSKCKCDLRQIMSFSSYSEGWATYVENYSYMMPDNGIDENLGKLLFYNSSASLGLYALLDININYYGWGMDEVESYLMDYFGIAEPDVVKEVYYTLIETPTNYLEYYVGFLEIDNMRLKAEKKLGDKFSAKDFNTFILDIGPAPFDVIQIYFGSWLLMQ